MDVALEKQELNRDTFKKKRYDLYKAQNWEEYQELLDWELEEREKFFAESLTAVCKALEITK